MKKSSKTVNLSHSTSHKIMAVVALVGLVACGFMIGWTMRGGDDAARAPVDVAVVDENLSTCQRIEELLTAQLASEASQDVDEHVNNVFAYQKLSETGCMENREKWQAMVNRELQIGNALWGEYFYARLKDAGIWDNAETEEGCVTIERAVLGHIEDCGGSVKCYLDNAELYASLVQKGCPGNAPKYRDLALQQIDIATALKAEKEMGNDDVESVIDTYKKLEMQEQAREVLDKVQRLANPAIDFILEMEKIINE